MGEIERLSDAILLLICNLSKDWISVKDKPISKYFDKYSISSDLKTSAIKFLKDNKYIEVEGEKSGMRYKNGVKLFPTEENLTGLVKTIIIYNKNRKKELKENRVPRLEKKAQKIVAPKNKIEEIIKSDDITIGSKRYILKDGEITEVRVVAVTEVFPYVIDPSVLDDKNKIKFVHLTEGICYIVEFKEFEGGGILNRAFLKKDLFKTPELLAESIIVRFKKKLNEEK